MCPPRSRCGETPDETIRRYLADKFFKDHLQTYKKRPIYWLFSSGKQGAFQALVYLHRYHEGTLARLRAEYVVPLTGKMQARLDMLQKDAQAAASTAARNKISKEIEKLKKSTWNCSPTMRSCATTPTCASASTWTTA